MAEEANIPRGWEYNPSTWSQRLPIVGLAVVGFGIASYLAAYQYQWVPTVWEPFFGDGSRKVLTSRLSHALPISDGALGAIGYLMDAVTGAIGGKDRWKTMPWIVIVFGLFIGPLGAVSIGLVMSQPLVVGEWCTLCLATALISLAMIGPALDEMLASLQHIKQEVEAGRSAWHVFWGLADEREPARQHR